MSADLLTRTMRCGEVTETDAAQAREVVLTGWVHRRRDLGQLVFVELRDGSGRVQVVFDPSEAADAHTLSQTLRLEDVVGIGGTALVDGILEEALRACRPDAYVLLVGPSTPLAPLLFAHGVDALSGSMVADPAAVLEQLREPHEGPTPRLRGMRPVTLHRA